MLQAWLKMRLAVTAALCLSTARAQLVCQGGCLFGQTRTGETCEPCPAGYTIDLATGDHCVACPAGKFSNASMTMCENCDAGFTSTTSSDECSACPAGRSSYPGDPECQACDSGKYTAVAGLPACEPCGYRLTTNSNNTGCVCKPGYFDKTLYPKMRRRSVVAWKDQPTEAECLGGPCCVDCSRVICPADVCHVVDETGEENVEKCAEDPSSCTLSCTVKHSCVQCPGGADGSPAYMWPRKMYWVPEAATLTIDPLNGEVAKKRVDATELMSHVAVEQCHPHNICAGLPESNASLTKQQLVDYEYCRQDPLQCCRNAEVQHGTLCGLCKPGFRPHPASSRCERCDSFAWGAVSLFFLRTTMMAIFFDFKARKINVEEEGGGLAILIFFAMQLSLYAQTGKNHVFAVAQLLISTFLTLEPTDGEFRSSECTFNLSPHGYFYFRVFFVPAYQYLLVLGIGKMVDRVRNPLDQKQIEDTSPNLLDKARAYLANHYDSSNLRYMRVLPEENFPEGQSKDENFDAMKLWWQGACLSMKRKQARKQLWRGQLQVLVAVYIPITKMCISMLFCRYVPDGDDGLYISAYDSAVECFATTHILAAIAALVVLVCFTCGFPLFIYIKMDGMKEPNGAWKPGRFTALVRLSYVFKENRRAWQAVVMLRQVYLVGAKVFADLYASPVNQSLPIAMFNGELDWRWGAFVPILLSVHLQARYRPYALECDNELEQACLLCLLLVIWADVTLATNELINSLVLAAAILSVAFVYVSQIDSRQYARSIKQADLFGFGTNGDDGDSGNGGASKVDVTSSDYDVFQTKSMGKAVRNWSLRSKQPRDSPEQPEQQGHAESTSNPVASEGVHSEPTTEPARAIIDDEVIKKFQRELRLTKDEIEAQIELFRTFDRDQSGELSVQELSRVFELGQGIHVSDNTIRRLMKEIDRDADGTISFAEFVEVMVRHNRQRDANEELVEAFKIFLDSSEDDHDEPASRITSEMIVALFKKFPHLNVDGSKAESMMRVARKDGGDRWRSGIQSISTGDATGDESTEPIPFPAFRDMMYEFGNPMTWSFGISPRKPRTRDSEDMEDHGQD